MKKLILILVFVLGFALQGWSANQVVAVDTIGSTVKFKAGTSVDCADTTGWTTGTTVQAAFTAAGASSEVCLCEGTYAGAMLNSVGGVDTTANSQTLRTYGAVILDGTTVADHVLNAASWIHFVIVGDTSDPLVIKGMSAGKYGLYGKFDTVSYVKLLGGNGGGGIQTDASGSLKRVEINGISGPGRSINLVGGGAVTLNFSTLKLINANSEQRAIYVINEGTGSTLDINNFICYGNGAETVYVASASKMAVTINNSIIVGNQTGNIYTINNASTAGGTVTLNNTLIHGSATVPDNYNMLNCTENDLIENQGPVFRSTQYPAGISLVVDDHTNLDWFYGTIVPKLEALGYRGVLSLSATHLVSAGDWVKLLELETNGHEIACHTRHHINLASFSTPFTISMAGETVEISAGTLTTSTPHSYVLSGYTMVNLRTQMDSDGYTVGVLATNYNDLPATLLDEVTAGTSINSAYSLALDQTKTFTEEVYNSRQDMLLQGLQAETFIPPGNATSAELRTYLKDVAGFTGARGAGTEGKTLASFNIFDVGFRDLDTHFDDTDACEASGETKANCIKRNVVAYLSYLGARGSLIAFYTHGESEWNANEWDALLAALSQSAIPVRTLLETVNVAKTYDPSGDLATSDGYTYTRSMIDVSEYRVRSASPCIDAGLWVDTINNTGEADSWGKYVHRLPNIGLDQEAGAPRSSNRILRIGGGIF